MLDQACGVMPYRQRESDLKDIAGDAHHTKGNHRFHRQGRNHERGADETYDFEVLHDPANDVSHLAANSKK